MSDWSRAEVAAAVTNERSGNSAGDVSMRSAFLCRAADVDEGCCLTLDECYNVIDTLINTVIRAKAFTKSNILDV